MLKTVALCPGNVDFPMVIKNKLQDLPEDGYHFKDKYEKPKAGIQTDKLDTFSDFSTIRAKDCELVIDGRTTVKCPNCKAFRRELHTVKYPTHLKGTNFCGN